MVCNAGRMRDSVNDKGLKTLDPKRAKNLAFEQTLQVLTMMSSFCSFTMHQVCNAMQVILFLNVNMLK